MTTDISFTTYLDEPISKDEFYALDKANIVYKVDGIIKKIEHFVNGYINYITYYSSDQETAEDVRKQFPNVKMEVSKRSAFGEYTLVDSSEYDKDGTLLFLTKRLYDEFDNVLCDQPYDLKTREPILKKTEKHLFDDPKEMAILSFEYDEKGMINYVWGDLVENTDQRQRGSIYLDKLSLYFPNLLTDHSYYRNSDLLPTALTPISILKH